MELSSQNTNETRDDKKHHRVNRRDAKDTRHVQVRDFSVFFLFVYQDIFFSVSLDPDEDLPDPEQFIGLLNFLDNDLSSEERSNFLNKTFPNIVQHALNLKNLRPKDGLHFSLQQQRKNQREQALKS